MKKLILAFLLAFLLFTNGQHAYSADDICLDADAKPVLSIQQVRQADLIEFIYGLSGMDPISPVGKSVDELYEARVKALLDSGYPPIIAEIEPDGLVTRRYFASMMYQVAVMTDPSFARKHGGLTGEEDQINALLAEEWILAAEGHLYREEIMSTLCSRRKAIEKIAAAVGEERVILVPENISEASMEQPLSPLD